jgi:phage recombination protein Bet
MSMVQVSPSMLSTETTFEFNPNQRQMIRDAYANGASEQEFAVLMEIACARRLNPLLRQIHFVKRWDNQRRREVWSAQASIDGLRAIAERTGRYDGQDEPEYVEKDGQVVACKVRVYRKDWSRPVVGVAHWEEYVQTTKDGSVTAFWKRMPHVMLAKCAESIALRKAFPEDMAGLYVPEEMGSSARAVVEVEPQQAASEPDLTRQLEASVETPSWPAFAQKHRAALEDAQSMGDLMTAFSVAYKAMKELDAPGDLFAELAGIKDRRKTELRKS